jgi:hypothetical protein
LESEVVGEKAVTRSVFEQSVRNGDQLGALRSEVATAKVDIQALTSRSDYVVLEVIRNTAALSNHGTLLTVLQQDVGALRLDATELHRGQEAINVRLDQMQADVDARFDRLESNVAAILAAVTPRNPV